MIDETPEQAYNRLVKLRRNKLAGINYHRSKGYEMLPDDPPTLAQQTRAAHEKHIKAQHDKFACEEALTASVAAEKFAFAALVAVSQPYLLQKAYDDAFTEAEQAHDTAEQAFTEAVKVQDEAEQAHDTAKQAYDTAEQAYDDAYDDALATFDAKEAAWTQAFEAYRTANEPCEVALAEMETAALALSEAYRHLHLDNTAPL